MGNMTLETKPPKDVHYQLWLSSQASLSVAKFLESYVSYVTNPKNMPTNNVYLKLSFDNAGLIKRILDHQ